MTLIIIVELKAKWLKRAACSVKISTKNSINLEEAAAAADIFLDPYLPR